MFRSRHAMTLGGVSLLCVSLQAIPSVATPTTAAYRSVVAETSAGNFSSVEYYRPDLATSVCGAAASTAEQHLSISRASLIPEGGTALHCNYSGSQDRKRWYVGYYNNVGGFTWTGTWDFFTSSNHVFQLVKRTGSNTDCFDFKVDSPAAVTLTACTGSSSYGTDVRATLATSTTSLTIPAQTYTNLRYGSSGGGFTNWSGNDSAFVTNAALCVRWVSGTSSKHGQNTTC